MNRTILAVLVLTLAAPAGAVQERDSQQEAFEAAESLASQALAAAKQRSQALRAARDAMRDDGTGIGPGVWDVVTIDNEQGKIPVLFAKQDEAVNWGIANGRHLILLSATLPPNKIVYATLIASKAAQRIYADMPVSAESVYMLNALPARVFKIMGGDFKALPLVDGDRVDAVKTIAGPWAAVENAWTACALLNEKYGLKTIQGLKEETSDPKIKAFLEKAQEKFDAFAQDEFGDQSEARAGLLRQN